ncbi:palmitoyltransferase [Elysia marginata]|uniref:Palmitoyltransferase n=1 Tax=Elysia marginata TaxID=1093978 RepID=A0AAV4JHZ2_9GAST|nr:palmitoyltransferase [Elysia marginata]
MGRIILGGVNINTYWVKRRINICIGASNHRYFLLAMLMFIVTGSYACHLTFTTICTPTMYLDWFLLPNDCRWLYADFLTSICFVTALYSAVGVAGMCMAFVYQFTLISQNVTSHELARARGLGMVTCGGLVALENPNNCGLIRNWLDFWLSPSGRSGVDAYKEAL